jgi:hypothetical protein
MVICPPEVASVGAWRVRAEARGLTMAANRLARNKVKTRDEFE